MVTQYLILILLLYTQSSISQLLEPKSPKETDSSAPVLGSAEVNSTPSSTLQDDAVESLLKKVTELSDKYKQDANETIEDIQQMIESDSSLPRLTRGEIIELLNNLTQTDLNELRSRVTKTRQEYQRAIMLVMPYTPKNIDSVQMEELFTKPPITHIVGSDVKKDVTTPKPHLTTNIEILSLEPTTSRPIVKRPRPFKVNIKTGENKQEIKYPYFQREEEKLVEKKKEMSVMEVSEKQEIRLTTRRPMAFKTTRFPNHKYPEENAEISLSNKEGIKVITAPSLVTQPDPIVADYWHYSQKTNKPEPQKDMKPHHLPHRHVRPNTMQSSVYKAASSTPRPRTRSTTTKTTPTSTTTESPLDNIGVPEEMKEIVKDMNLIPQKFSSHYDESIINFPKQETVTENVRDLLDSIGVLPVQQSTTQLPDISDIADNLSPDMRELLMNFGLIDNPNLKPIAPVIAAQIPDALDISPHSYTQFKPLPDSAPSRKDMEEFLAGFGLTSNSQRSAKKLEIAKTPTHLSEVPDFNIDMIPESMHDVLVDIGLSQKKDRKLVEKNGESTHVFKPESTYVSEGEIKRLNQLLETIKRLEKMNRTATPEDLKDLDLENIKELTKILKQDSSVPLNQQHFGPDPLDFGLSVEKNEVKRQESTTSTAKPTEDPKSSQIAALEESFGGTSGSASETVDESLPPPRKTGFYYLVDWNTFLEVGEDGRDKVSIRFSPSAGDPSRFINVKVP